MKQFIGSDAHKEEMERAGHRPRSAHALTAKRRMEGRHKTDERDRAA